MSIPADLAPTAKAAFAQSVAETGSLDLMPAVRAAWQNLGLAAPAGNPHGDTRRVLEACRHELKRITGLAISRFSQEQITDISHLIAQVRSRHASAILDTPMLMREVQRAGSLGPEMFHLATLLADEGGVARPL